MHIADIAKENNLRESKDGIPLASDDDDGAATISSFGAFLLIAPLILKRTNKEVYPPRIAIDTTVPIEKGFVL
ncbi:MAG: hypothetical protein ACI8RD_005220 [Bacillariaceae sp.]|jgi:hypothetical protein